MRSGFRWLVLLCGVIFIIFSMSVLDEVRDNALPYVLLLGFLIICDLFAHSLKRGFDIFEPAIVFSVVYFYILVLRPIYILVTGDYTFFNEFAVDDAYFLPAVISATVGYLFYAVGYRTQSRASACFFDVVTPRIRYAGEIKPARLLLCCLTLAATGTATYVYFYVLKHPEVRPSAEAYMGSTAYVYEGLWLLVPVTILFFAFRRRRLYFRALFWISLIGSLYIFLGLHNRSRWLTLLVSLFVMYYLQRGKRPSVVTTLLLGLFMVASAVITVMFRGVMTLVVRGDFPDLSLDLKELFFGSLSTLGGNMMFDMFIFYLQNIPTSVGYLWGLGFLQILVHPIPRILWESKPPLQNTYFMQRVLPEHYEGGLNLPPSILGDFYLNFGFVGIAAGMFVIGVLLRGTYLWFKANERNVAAQITYAFSLVIVLVLPTGQLTNGVVQLLILLLPTAVALRISARRGGRRSMGGETASGAWDVQRKRSQHFCGPVFSW